jgi:beta-galactosidase
MADDVAEQLVEYVRQGGVLMTDCRAAVKDETNLAHVRTLPGVLSPALGIEIEEYESLGLGITDKETTAYKVYMHGMPPEGFTAINYADWITPKDAEAIARFDQPHLERFAAVTRNKFGKGVGWYVGTIVQEETFYDALIRRLLDDAKTQPIVEPPAGVEVSVRENDERRLLFLINHTPEEQTVGVPQANRELITGRQAGRSWKLEPFGVAVIELPAE